LLLALPVRGFAADSVPHMKRLSNDNERICGSFAAVFVSGSAKECGAFIDLTRTARKAVTEGPLLRAGIQQS
jgi:hypothetical protein